MQLRQNYIFLGKAVLLRKRTVLKVVVTVNVCLHSSDKDLTKYLV